MPNSVPSLDNGPTSDRQKICAVLLKYFTSVDAHDWECLRSCYHADARDDHDPFFSNLTVDEIIQWAREQLPLQYPVTFHVCSQALVELAGTQARSQMYAIGYNWSPPSPDGVITQFTVGAHVLDEFGCRNGDWRITYRHLIVDWTRSLPIAAATITRGPDKWEREASIGTFSFSQNTLDQLASLGGSLSVTMS